MAAIILDGEEMSILESTYKQGGATALRAVDSEGMPFMTITVNVVGYVPPTGHILAKTWAENEPWREELLASGLFEDTGKRIPSGFVEAEVWKRNF